MFSGLVRFKEEHGHCNVPDKWSENPQLGSWVGTQRVAYNRSKLSPDRVERLEGLGFEWDAIAATFKDYPPRQKPGSFSIDQVLESLQIGSARQ